MTKLTASSVMEAAEKCLRYIPANVPLTLDFLSEYVRNYMGEAKSNWNKKYSHSGHPIGKNGVQHELRKLKFDVGDQPIFFNHTRGYWTRLRDY